MRTLDWYILKKFFLTFFLCMLLLTAVAVAVDSSERADDFLRAGFNTMELINNYYLGFVPWIWSLLFPLFVFIAVIYFTSRMASRSEVIAILSGGMSYNRFLLPFFIGGLFFAVLLWVGTRYWIPKANVIRSNFQAHYVDRTDPTKNRVLNNCFNCYYLRTDSNTFVSIREYDTSSRAARGFSLNRIQNNRVVYNLRSEWMRWDTATNKWKLSNAAERVIDSMGETLRRYPELNIDLDLRPAELKKDLYIKDKLTTAELVAFIRQEELRGTEGLNVLKVERYRRTATPATVLLLTMIGAIVASRKTRGGSGVHMAIGIAIAALFILSDRFSTTFAVKGNFSPFIAAWLPNVVFTGVAYWLYRQTPK